MSGHAHVTYMYNMYMFYGAAAIFHWFVMAHFPLGCQEAGLEGLELSVPATASQ